jgi:ferritin
MDPNVEKAFNLQLNREFFSSYVYLAVSAFLEARGLKGMAAWVRFRAGEENLHAFKFYDFILERDGRLMLTGMEAPPNEWPTVLAAFASIYEHEKMITRCINDLVSTCAKSNDNASQVFLQWFITEQVEEESSTKAVVDKLRLIGENGIGLYLLDRELGGLATAAPSAGGADQAPAG